MKIGIDRTNSKRVRACNVRTRRIDERKPSRNLNYIASTTHLQGIVGGRRGQRPHAARIVHRGESEGRRESRPGYIKSGVRNPSANDGEALLGMMFDLDGGGGNKGLLIYRRDVNPERSMVTRQWAEGTSMVHGGKVEEMQTDVDTGKGMWTRSQRRATFTAAAPATIAALATIYQGTAVVARAQWVQHRGAG